MDNQLSWCFTERGEDWFEQNVGSEWQSNVAKIGFSKMLAVNGSLENKEYV